MVRFQQIFRNKTKTKYYAFRYLVQNRPKNWTQKIQTWTINHSCILSTPVKDLFCEIVALFSFLFFVGKLVILKLEPQELQLLSFESPLYQFTMLQFIFGPLSITSNFKPLSFSKRKYFDAYEQTRNTSHCKTAAANSFCSKSHLCTSRRLDCVRNDGAMPPHTCQDFYFSQSRSRLSTWNFTVSNFRNTISYITWRMRTAYFIITSKGSVLFSL